VLEFVQNINNMPDPDFEYAEPLPKHLVLAQSLSYSVYSSGERSARGILVEDVDYDSE